MNKLIFLGGFILLSTYNPLHAQLTGGTSRGMETPTTARPEETLTTLSDGDVDLFSGVYQHSINLGTVSTTTGTSFTLTMNYSSSGVTSRFQNQDNTIPLGEGWSLNLPYIKFITDTPQKKYSNYVYQQKMEQYNQAMYSNTVFDSSSSIAGIFTFCDDEARSEFVCKIKGISLNLPGIYSGMMTYKYSNTLGEAVFVPKTFDKYFELTFQIFGNQLYGYELMPEAKIRLNDGTVYEFYGFDYHYVNPPNILGASGTEKPVMVYDGLGISRIWNPHLSEYESIDFKYSSYGRVNHFAEFSQFIVNSENFSTSSETRLDEILVNDGMSSSHISQRLKLNYKLKGPIQLYADGQFTYLDSMYIMKTIFNSGEIRRPLFDNNTPNVPWTQWNKYYHAAKAPNNTGWTNTQTNWLHNFPYVYGNGKQQRDSGLSNANVLNHSYIELTNINRNLFKSGKMYEIRVAMRDNEMKCTRSLIDIDFIYSNSGNEHTRSSGIVTYPRFAASHTRGTVMSTFYRPIKWFDDGYDSIYNPAIHKYEVHPNTSSNFFIAPDPVDANFDANTNFILKIGPANSDNYMDVPLVNMTKNYPNGLQLSLFSHTHRKTYWTFRDATTRKNLKCYKYCEPCGYNFISPNFGLGLPWGQSLGLYDVTIPGTTTNACSDISPYFNFSHYHGTADFSSVIKARSNKPTAFNDFTIKSVQITELEKIPVMLKEVRLYDYRNAIKAYIRGDNGDEGSQYANTIKEDSNLVSIKKFEWGEGSIPNYPKSGVQSYSVKKYLLTQLFSQSINSADNHQESFGYTKLACTGYSGSSEQNTTNNFNSQFYLLTSIVNNLGLKKTIDYQPTSKFWNLKNDVVQFNFIVNSVTKEPALASGSTGEQKITHYDFKDFQSAGLCFDTRKLGFGDVTVLHPIIPGSTSRKRTNYTFDICKGRNLALRCMPSNINQWLTYGKLLRVIDYNENSDKVKEVNFEYKKQLAFKNGLHRFNPLNIQCTYADGGDYAPANLSAKYAMNDYFTGNYRPLTIEFNPDNHSYFTAKSKVTTTEFFQTKAGIPTSTDFIEEYEYYDADSNGTYHNDGHKIITENSNATGTYNIDPSWNLYKTISYSNANSSFKSVKEIFYMYQFLDRDMDCTYNLDEGMNGEDNSFFWSSNVVKILFLKYHLKHLITEIRTSNITETNTGSFDTIRKSKYFKYDLTYIDNENYNDNLPEEETIYDSTFKKTKCPIYDPEDIEIIKKDSAKRAIDSIVNLYIERGCEFFFAPKFNPFGPGGSWVSSDGQKMEDWNEKRRYYETINGGCYIRRFDARVGKWVRCPCTQWEIWTRGLLVEGIGHRTANFIGLKDLISLKGITASPTSGNSPLDPIVLVGTSGVVGGYSSIGSHGNYHQLTPMQKQEIKPSFNSTRDGELEAIANRTAKYSINAFDEDKIYSIINDSLTNEVGFLVLPTLNKLLTINMDKLGDFNTIQNMGNPYPYSEQNHSDMLQGLSYLQSRFSPENIIPIDQFVATVNPIVLLPFILKENGEGDPPPRYYPPEHNMRILFKSEHEKVDDLVIESSGQWRNSPETRYDIGRFTNLSTLSFHIPFNNIKQKEILLRNNFLQTELEMDAKQMLTKYYYGNYSFKRVCNSKKCPDVKGNMVPSGECHRALSYNSMFLPVRITTGFWQPDSIGINLYYNKNATLSHTISDQGARIDYKYDGFNRLIETKKDGHILARYNYNMWDRGSYTGIDAITNQNFIETRTWINKTNHEGTISRSFIDPFGRKMGSILATSADLTTSPASYTDAIMSGYQQLDWEEKPVKQYKPFQVTGGLQLYRNTTSSSAPQEHQQFTYDFKSQPLRSYDFDVSASSSNYSESTTTLEDGNYFNTEIQPNALEKAILGWDATHKYLRTESRDPDGKKHISYSHVNGKKMADHIFMGGSSTNINTLYGYDRKWDLKKVLDPEKMETSYLTNLQGLVFEKVTPDQGMSLYFYDEVGSLVAMQDKKLWSQNLLRMRIFTYDHFGRMLLQLVGDLNARTLCPNCGFTNTTGGGGGRQNYRPANPMAYTLYLGARHYDISYPPSNNPVLQNSYGRSYHWLPNKNVLDENGEGKFTIFDSLFNIKIEKHFVYNDTSKKYIDNVERSPNHNALYKTKLNEIISTLTADVKSEIGAKKQKSLGKLSIATSYDHNGNINEIVTTTYNADELPENEYHYARFNPYISSNTYTKRFLLKYKDYNLTGKPAEVELLQHNPGGTNTHEYSTRSSFNTLGHLTQLQFKQGASATSYSNLADYSYHLPSGKLTDVEAKMNSSFSLKTFYTYDKRERLTHINNNMFEEKLYYDNNFPAGGIGTNIANYNGNINGVYTHHKGCAGLDPLTYRYHYDAANRLSKAFSDAKMMPSGAAFGTQEFSYLRNGSMHSFTTEELNAGFMSTKLRNNYFHYFTGTNKLEKISPTAGGNVTAPFTTNNRSFNYDGNGNISTDYLRGNNLLYDRANLPYRLNNGNTTYAFGYNTADARIFKGNDNQAYYYLAGSVYDMKNDKWEHYPGGLAVIKKISSVYNLNLIIKDHLTNTRAVVDVNDGCSGPTYEAQYDYYPYSKILRKQESPRSRFQSTDHETDLETGYNNRNARWYDDESFQFLQIDPLSDIYPSYTPYNYVERNPISLIDPTGMYGSKAESDGQIEAAKERGYNTNDAVSYQMDNGEWAFNLGEHDASGTYTVSAHHQFDFKLPIAAKIENFLQKSYDGAPSWITNMSNEGSWAHRSLSVVGDFAMGMNPVSNTRSLFSGQNWQGEQQHRGWAVLGLATMGLSGEVNAAAKGGVQATESVIKGFTGHATNQAITRGFKSADILKIVREGTPVEAMGRYGSQMRYTLGGNTVVLNAQGKVVTLFSNASGTANGLGKGFFIPFK